MTEEPSTTHSGEPRPRRLVVDRIEGDLVVVELDGDRFLDLPRWLLPRGVREGDVILARATPEEDRHHVEFWVDRAATEASRRAVHDTLSRLRDRDPGGNIEL